MSAVVMSGKKCSESIYAELKRDTERLIREGIVPCLDIIRSKDNEAGAVYARQKANRIRELGGMCNETIFDMEDKKSFVDAWTSIKRLNFDPLTHGIIVQLPFCDNERGLLNIIAKSKDVDRIGNENIASFYSGNIHASPCTPAGIMRLLDYYNQEVTGKRAVVIGRSDIVGKPMAHLLTMRDATVTLCHSKTENIKDIVSQADIIVCAVGKPNFITKDFVKAGATVIDVGINRINGKLCGDVSSDVMEVAGYMTPVPGGVGPMTVAMLVENTIKNAERFIYD